MSIEFAYESKMLWARQFAACLPPGQIQCLPRTLSSLFPFPRIRGHFAPAARHKVLSLAKRGVPQCWHGRR